ncbi:mandelate racemase/muconate lactonizing enzyme family protein [Thalassospiraceae bacterium LMO-JJ14]|nr:mandelate racemase/muconate lactonizing enzyme family protein [Thalassospiraceae bacterium LMO-JJ14]
MTHNDACDFSGPLRLHRIDAWAFRIAIERPVETSFGIMRSRPAVFVRLEADDGSFGFGEIWCNFPACGAEHRVMMAIEELGPLLTAGEFTSPQQAFAALSRKVHVRILQTAEPGPYNQAIAGIDIALWDLAARRAGKPVRTFIDPDAQDRVPVYASGIHIGIAESVIDEARATGIRNFKVKVGFDTAQDLAALARIAPMIGNDERLFSDANQAWDLDQALEFTKGAADAGLGWLEEPLLADAPFEDWQRLAAEGGVALAAGENITGLANFEAAIDGGYLRFVQPDMAKWGGFSANLDVARAIIAGGLTYCPHYLGGGIGLVASAHLLAAVGGDGILEVDTNPNPLRESIPGTAITDGDVVMTDAPGLGIDEIPGGLMEHVTLHRYWQD